MRKHERIAVELLEAAFGDRWTRDDTRIFSFGPGGGTGEVDGTIDGRKEMARELAEMVGRLAWGIPGD